MTDQELRDYYADLLILQYKNKAKAYAHIQALVTPVIMNQLPTKVMNAFDLTGANVAEGVQLDILGKYVGVSRSGYGFDGQVIMLNDADYLSLIQLATAKHNADASLATIQSIIALFFDIGSILVFDYKNMKMSYLISSLIGSQDFIQLFVTAGLIPRPLGVSIPLIIYAPVINTFFGFRTYTLPAVNSSPFNSYVDYTLDTPWVSYKDAIVF